MARLAALLAVTVCAAVCRAESDPELLQLGERALCAASHSQFARTGGGTIRAQLTLPGTVTPPGFNAFLVFGVRPCSGALLSEWYIITSAYCTEHAQNGTAFLGGLKYQSVPDLRRPEVMISLVRDFRYFSNSDPDLDHDVAIVKLDRKCYLSDMVSAAELTRATSWDEPEEAYMMGFGETFEGDFAHELRSSAVTLECGPMCSEHVDTYRLGANALCGSNTSSAMCWGDMGGGVVDTEGRLVALIAYKTPKAPSVRLCTQPAAYTFFMFIGYYRDWIDSIVSSAES